MNSYKYILLLVMFFTGIYFSQTQEKIPWPSLADSPWPVARGDVQATGRSEYVGPKTPNIIWKKSYPFGILNGPVMGERAELYFGARAANYSIPETYFYCTDSLGNELWRYVADHWTGISSAPAIGYDGTIYVGSHSGNFYAINSNGTLKWKYRATESFFIDNLVIDMENNIYVGSVDSLYCFDKDGKLKFVRYSPGLFSVSISPEGETLYVPTRHYDSENKIYSHYIRALDLTGNELWNVELKYRSSGAILVDNQGNLYVQGKQLIDPDLVSSLICINPDGSIKWNFEVRAMGHYGAPTMDKIGNIFFFGENSSYEYGIYSLDYKGNFRWFCQLDGDDDGFEDVQHGLVCDADGTIYVGSAWGNYLYAISNSGDLLWKIPLDGMYADSSPVIGRDGTLYIGLNKGVYENQLENTLIAIKDNPNSVKEEELPSEYKLEQNYPNPFNPTTSIEYQVASIENVTLKVYDILGREIATLLNEVKHPGNYKLEFNASNLPSGVYFYRLNAGGFSESKKMILLR